MMIDSDRSTGELPVVVENDSLAGEASQTRPPEYEGFTGTAADIPGASASRIVGLGFIWILLNRDRRGWHDYIAGSRVVYERPAKRI